MLARATVDENLYQTVLNATVVNRQSDANNIKGREKTPTLVKL